MRIGELARRTGVSTRLLRYYEEQGLMVPQRSANGYRDYSEEFVDQIAQIRSLLDGGLADPGDQAGAALPEDTA